MKKAGLIIGIPLMILSGIGCVRCLLLPSLTGNKVSFEGKKKRPVIVGTRICC